jgi:hypothetical protein
MIHENRADGRESGSVRFFCVMAHFLHDPWFILISQEQRKLIMEDKNIYMTVNHLGNYESISFLKPGDRLILKKDRNNVYDDEAIAVYKDQVKCGYVANSVHSVARGTCSAGRLYDRIGDESECLVRFIMAEEGSLIAQLNDR